MAPLLFSSSAPSPYADISQAPVSPQHCLGSGHAHHWRRRPLSPMANTSTRFFPNTGASVVNAGALTVDGIRFNVATSSSTTNGSDGKISFLVTSGVNNQYGFNTFPSAPPSSPAFAAVMDSGGTYENGGAGSGAVSISGLTVGHVYSVQVFNYANDGDDGLTTLSGVPSVTIGNLPGLAGPEYLTWGIRHRHVHGKQSQRNLLRARRRLGLHRSRSDFCG